MLLLRCSLGLMLAALSSPVLAQPAQAGPKPVETSQRVTPATAAALARAVAPLELGVATEIEQARKAILALPTVDEDAKQLEQEYPGLYAALWAAVEPEVRQSSAAGYPGYWAELEKMYIARLTESEAQAVLTFFKSPTGQKLVRNMYGNVDAAPLMAEMAKSDDYAVNEKRMKALVDSAKAKTVKEIGAEDQADLWILMTSIDLKKFQALGAETQKVTLEWVNRPDPEGEERIGKIMEEAMQRYMEAHPSGK